MSRKQYTIKVFDSSGNITGLFNDFVISGFTNSLNGGNGELTVVVPRRFDAFGEGQEIDMGYRLELAVSDNDTPNGVVIYNGVIVEIGSEVAEREDVTITAVGFISQLAETVLESAGNNVYFKYNKTEIATILKDIIDKYKASNSNAQIDYTSSSIATTGKTVTTELFLTSPLDALDLVARLGDANFYYFIGADNILHYKAIPTTPTHLFTLGRDILYLGITKNILSTVNNFVMYNGQTTEDADLIFKKYSDSTSIAKFGKKWLIKRDGRFKSEADGAEDLADRTLDTYGDALNTVRIRVVDNTFTNGIDIESIKPGDTCKVLNTAGNSALTQNMLITRVDYSIRGYVDLTILDAFSYTDRLLLERKQQYSNIAFEDNMPKKYTT